MTDALMTQIAKGYMQKMGMECGVSPVQFFDLDVVEPVAESVIQDRSGFGIYLIHIYPYRPVDVDG